jgi:hypothetical protein
MIPSAEEALGSTKRATTETPDSVVGGVFSTVPNALRTAADETEAKTSIVGMLDEGTRKQSEVSSSVINPKEDDFRLIEGSAPTNLHIVPRFEDVGLQNTIDARHTTSRGKDVSKPSTASLKFLENEALLCADIDSRGKRILLSHSFNSVDRHRNLLSSASSLSSDTWTHRYFDLHNSSSPRNIQLNSIRYERERTRFSGVNSEPLPLFDQALFEVEGFLTAPGEGCVCVYDHLPVPHPTATKVRLHPGALSSSLSYPLGYFNLASDSDDTKGSRSERGIQFNSHVIPSEWKNYEVNKSTYSESAGFSLLPGNEKKQKLSNFQLLEQDRPLHLFSNTDLELGGSAKPSASSEASFGPLDYYIINNNSRPSNKEALLKPVDSYYQGLSIPYSLSKRATFSSIGKKKKKKRRPKVWEQTQKILARTHVGFQILTMERRRLKTTLLFIMLPVWMTIWTVAYAAIEGVRIAFLFEFFFSFNNSSVPLNQILNASCTLPKYYVSLKFTCAIFQWKTIESVYFIVQIFTTVGFGDVQPKTALGLAVFPIASVGGITLLATCVAHVAVYMSTTMTWVKIKNLVLLYLVVEILASLIFMYLEHWTWGQSLYFLYNCASTTGLSEEVPKSSLGRIAFCFLMLIVFSIFTTMIKLMVDNMMKGSYAEGVDEKEMTRSQFNKMLRSTFPD